jgi:erythromycin esterase
VNRRTVYALLCAYLLGEGITAAPAYAGPLASSPADTLASALREHATPLRSASDLDPILDSLGGRRAVLLGEASHGTEEFYAWRAEISKRLIADADFRFIAVEGDWGACAAVNRYVKHMEGAPGSARAAVTGFSRWPEWLWSNQVILELVEWLHEHNAELPMARRVGFYGIDVYGLDESMAKAPRYLDQLDEGLAREARQAYACLERFDGDMRRYLQGVVSGESCAAGIARVVERLQARRAEWQDGQADDYFHAKQNALVVLNAERHYRAMIHQDHTSWNARARHFHRTLERLLERYGEHARGIVWAHNTHIGDARATAMAQQGMVNIGQLARESLGPDEVALVGFGTHRGQVVAGARWEAPRQVMDVPRALSGSLEDVLHRVMDEPFVLLTEETRQAPGIERPLGHRAIGVSYNPLQEHANYVPTVLPDRYDAFVFIPETTPLRGLSEDHEARK